MGRENNRFGRTSVDRGNYQYSRSHANPRRASSLEVKHQKAISSTDRQSSDADNLFLDIYDPDSKRRLTLDRIRSAPKMLRRSGPYKEFQKLSPKIRHTIVAGSIATVLVVPGFMLLQRNNSTGNDAKGEAGVLSAKSTKPSFSYVLPGGKSESLAGGIKFDSDKGVVSFRDSIGGVAITVSQQRLPEGLRTETADKVRRLAEDFSAKEVISTSNPTAYLGTSSKGPQTVVFYKNETLVFIQSAKQIDKHDWSEYITRLR